MKKMILIIISLTLVLALSGCFGYRDIESNFEDAGYTYSEDSTLIFKGMLNEFEADGIEVDVYTFNKSGRVAVIIALDNKDDITTSFEQNQTLHEWTSEFEREEIVRGKYIVIPIATTEEGKQEIIDIFQK